ncbi:prolyl-tRNA editing enzyme YbaK/EbsC (Cys-tRNA(Pro) deacylase) [Deinobacterium chartae]|uniref:Prolyl-tRNA editing enzyme YbaK/EbsC (Cys-tRNA(Pro) deacylase) n=1 Tax=Deinobacterium chartae TaxID=521158 RepID=A0A841HZS5_9DEIO|nr:YbaK/EbsC family protein [Deinobacterium chartae]MBB6098443.1 prolyl-tRNA editing enzyme YbaK/EbsC (Cys-tRNA(Pro) deacylase) [Deinobacterium chartae]
MTELSPSARRVQEALRALNLNTEVVELPGSTRTAQDAAATLGCGVAQIAKSLVFRSAGGEAVITLLSGAHRASEARLSALLGEGVSKADARFVREQTGFAVGGVPPFGHIRPLTTFLDDALLSFPEVFAAGGTPHAVVRLTPDDLRRLPGVRIVTVREET